ncbi:MAG: YqzE family protein [Bacillaceae bacterium]|jgi:hypothetical protein|uniref:YqzE family protein n=1 Tax=Aeribacillus TaxID=1055323 RepID=UPI000E37B174|nr:MULTISPECIES: YqzE family protein [Aeribacillus]REJ18519.1 MAG: YqzE family protein [Bacillaceae bacterium]MDR9795736.1 YqzE family protein [Aeribacillus pallidus]MED0704431.1 YqzE family protein [Aeribacillus composti]MED1438305.1 YqzE family protein [Aeribacillus composti]MED1442146.1 YqzE family protein [Aeribacillus composti]
MSGNDYVKYVTEQFVKFIDTPKETRKQRREERKKDRLPLSMRWFGFLPMAFLILIKKKK